MQKRAISLFSQVYSLLLYLYPAKWRQTYGEEMLSVFAEAVMAAAQQNSLGRFCYRELCGMPKAITKVHWNEWVKKWQKGLQQLQEVTSTATLPPPPPDGRDSWQQAGLELSLFLIISPLLIATYLPWSGATVGWQHDLDFLGQIILPLTLPFFLLGLARGLPRWAYPWGGLLLGYQVLTVNQAGLWPFLVVMLIATTILTLTALMTASQTLHLPILLRRIGQSFSLDWTRLCFGVYGAMPLAIIIAFDDGYANNQTPYLALSAVAMVLGALLYIRSRHQSTQFTVLVGGMSLSVWAAWWDKVAFAARVDSWIAAPYPDAAEIAWVMQLWVTWTCMLLFLALLTTISRAARRKRPI